MAHQPSSASSHPGQPCVCQAIAVVSRYVVVADWLFTATTAVIQPATGFWMAQQATALPAQYWRYFRIWFALGIAAFAAFVVIFWLMVTKTM